MRSSETWVKRYVLSFRFPVCSEFKYEPWVYFCFTGKVAWETLNPLGVGRRIGMDALP